MAQPRKPDEGTRTQRQKFMDAAREHGADAEQDAFRRAVRSVATAPTKKVRKAARKRKR